MIGSKLDMVVSVSPPKSWIERAWRDDVMCGLRSAGRTCKRYFSFSARRSYLWKFGR